MQFRTLVSLPAGTDEIRHADRLLLWGSCFTEHIGAHLRAARFRCLQNPYGVLYNPSSIAAALREVLEAKRYEADDLFFDRGLWGSRMHHTSFSDPDRDECLRRVNDSLSAASAFLPQADWLLLTFGTARVYAWKADGCIVGNCHKLPERLFTRRLLSVEDICAEWRPLLERLRAVRPQLKVLFTVSPIRHAKDGMHGNQLSKATLLLAIDRLCQEYPFCRYFPAYELLMDELRDYRFYADDMLHPSTLAVDYIWDCFCRTYFSAATLRVMKECEAVGKALDHRPFRPGSEAHLQFLAQLEAKVRRLQEQYPYLEFPEVLPSR